MRKTDCSSKWLILTLLLSLTVMPMLYAQVSDVYKVQVASSKIRYSVERISSDLRLQEPLSLHFIDGRYKYFVGTFSSEAEAIEHLPRVPVDGAFVVKLSGELENLADTVRLTPTDTIQAERMITDSVEAPVSDTSLVPEIIPHSTQEAFPYQPPVRGRNPVIYILLGLAGAVLLILLIVTIINSINKRWRLYREMTRDRVKERLTHVVLEEEGEGIEVDLKTEKMSHLEKQLLIEEIMKLYPNLSGEIGNRMRAIYVETGLKNESVAKLKNLDWKVRAEGFRELAVLNVPVALEEIERSLNSNNMALRMEARLALIRLDRDDPWCFLSRMKKTFTEWEQLKVYELLKSSNVAIPDFGRWIDSSNQSVVIFCIRMIRAFNQQESHRSLIPLLYHDNPEIRQEVIMTLGHFRKSEFLPLLVERYGIENQDNKKKIIKAVAQIPNDEAANFLRGILDPDQDLRMEAAEALASIESVGLNGIEEILRKSDEKLQTVGRYLLLKKLEKSLPNNDLSDKSNS
ncbi:MAG: HEAT repeat domain-containing protein [Bacteroidales bacterium]|nr:HEAT repeat domain-containing protein [Bacteroidales bacterium]